VKPPISKKLLSVAFPCAVRIFISLIIGFFCYGRCKGIESGGEWDTVHLKGTAKRNAKKALYDVFEWFRDVPKGGIDLAFTGAYNANGADK
jgi:hypothetical protein